jgi:two-component system, NtrC family, nitrogen regulation sensor histidine kinase NtrY
MRLSTELLRKAYEDRSPDFPKIFEQTTETILTHVEALRRIAADFSSFAGLPQTRPEPVPVVPILRDCLNLYDGWAKEKQIATGHTGDEGIVLADREELRRLFINLLDNAFEAVGSPGTIRIVSRSVDGFLDVEVTDSGAGIPTELQARLFQPYFSTKTTGTGLGLAICHRIVTELRGTLTLASEAGRGTTAHVRLPLWDGGEPARP